MLGVAKALDRIINYKMSGEESVEAFHGYHLDLKPSNILIEENGRCRITDFGRATFKRGDGTSRIEGMGGAAAYAPPEADAGMSQTNRKYDIWSLGCIFLEVCAFVVGGYDGVAEFDAMKTTARDPRVRDDRLFSRKGSSPQSFEVKPEVLNWMKQLPERSVNLRTHSRKFLQSFLEMTKLMLSVNVNERLSSTQVCEQLNALLGVFQPVPLGKGLLNQVPSLYYALGPLTVSNSTSMRIYEDSSRFITAVDCNKDAGNHLQVGPRKHTGVIPSYAFSSTKVELKLQRSGDERSVQNPLQCLLFQDIKHAIIMQSILSGQDIRRCITLSGGQLHKRPALRAKLRFQGSKAGTIEAFGSEAMVQLWSEESYKEPEAWRACQRKNTPRSLTEYFLHGALPRRVVVYFQSTMIIVRLAKNMRLEKKAHDRCPTTCTLIPTDKTRDSTFTACIIKSKHGQPAIPLDRATINEEELRHRIECESLSLAFQNEHDAKAFLKTYQVLKSEWHSEEKQVEELKKYMAMNVGYAPN